MAYVERNRRRLQPIIVKDTEGIATAAVPGDRAITEQYGRRVEGRRSAGDAGDAVAGQWGGRPGPSRGNR
ncbi:MAG: hypothetical protein M0038_06705 [Pseudomonadota bacterium]|jgi:hypothetical protein|nr:hypothetical protein [Pseudomonadota bacterium]